MKYSDDEKCIDAMHQDLKAIASVINQQMQALPLGHEYQGTFYIRKPYTVPTTSIKITGTAYMQEDLVSWRITTDDSSVNAYGNYREIFKDPELTQVISRDEGRPIFEENDHLTL